MRLKLVLSALAACAAIALSGCGQIGPTKIVLMLDWVPNTNHTGIYVALDKGWYSDQGLDIEVIQPGETGVEQVVGSGKATFGISYAEWLTMARAQGVPIVSIAAIIQHNSSGFASPAALGLTRPRDLAGHRYGGAGLDIERAMLGALMRCDGASVDTVEFVDTGYADYFTITRGQVDFAWIYYAWTGVDAEMRGEATNVIWLRDYPDCVPDYYTPVIITNEETIAKHPDLVRRFMAATASGYQYAIDNPDESAEILASYAEADAELIRRSQQWLSPRYNEDGPQWGYQDPAVWERFVQWMSENGLVSEPIDAAQAFTNEFLPGRE